MAPRKTVPLRPMPMRVTQRQFERLQEVRERDGYSTQEHIRRAIDEYLDKLDRNAAPTATTLSVVDPGEDVTGQQAAATPTPVPEPVPTAKQSVAKRGSRSRPRTPQLAYR